jgi:hypothetical protein
MADVWKNARREIEEGAALEFDDEIKPLSQEKEELK